ncbi:MAG: iron chelate uptake ABC transporter family permease subunit, partial [Chloroflexi bacterium]|nr:iron chelate uptake ABC transporter family permease subunit [Chloroflexota bacterium]
MIAVRAQRYRRLPSILLLTLAILVAVILLSAVVGAVAISPAAIVKMSLNSTGIFHFPQTWPDSAQNIFLQIRLPRIIGAMLVGAALSTAGVLFQGLLR